MIKLFKVAKREVNLPKIVVYVGLALITFHIFSYLIPFTNNAFVATKTLPVAADVEGFITELYVNNGQHVKKGDKLFKVFQEPYQLAYNAAKADHQHAQEVIKVIDKRTQKTRELLDKANFEFEKAKIKYKLKSSPSVSQAISSLEIKILDYELQAVDKLRRSLKKQIEVEDQEIITQRKKVESLKAKMDNALVNLNLTIVKAPCDGVVNNLYIAVGTPVKIHQPLFSLIDTSTYWIQANFNETDLRNVRPGDKADIILRMYYFNRLFEGEVTDVLWASDRQITVNRTQLQKVNNENEWLLIPQRLPVQIKILNPDPNFPLHPGASAYVYIRTH